MTRRVTRLVDPLPGGRIQGRNIRLNLLLLSLLVIFLPAIAQEREITDMSGSTVILPDTITTAVAVSPPGTYLLYAIDPHLIGGLNFPLWDNEKKYTIPAYGKLPVIGGLVGQGRTINREVLLRIKPDVILYWAWKKDATTQKFMESLAPLHVPLLSVRLDRLDDYPEALRFVGEAVNRPERGRALAATALRMLAEVKNSAAQIPTDKRVTVYYAEGTDGLSTERAESLHAELIPLCGGINVHQGEETDHYGMEKIAMEQLLLYDPDVILVKERLFFDSVAGDPRWKNLRAVREKRVYLIPYVPFNWFDRPPSFMRLLGAKWLLNVLHPESAPMDMIAETRAFYALFLGVELSEPEAREVLNR